MKSTESKGGGASSVLEPLLVAVGLTLAVSYRFFEPIWEVGPATLSFGLATAAAYVAGYVSYRRSARRGFVRVLLVTIVVSQPVLLLFWVADLPVSRIVLAYQLALLFAAVASSGLRAPASRRLPVALGLAVLAALPTLMALDRLGEGRLPAADPNVRYVFTSYQDVSITTHEVVEPQIHDGGSLSLLPGGRVLLVTGKGEGRLLDFSDGLAAEPIELAVPLDVAAYTALGRDQPEHYRVFDAVYDAGSLFVSHIHWDPQRGCYALRLIEAGFDGTSVGPWVTRFESQPCVVQPHMGNTSGGRIGLLGPSSLLLAIGTFGIDVPGWTEESDYGKIIELDRETWQYEVFSRGHRNPEGLLVEGDLVWSTEHGPHGGDELNLIEAGSDYGWPFVSYGTDYGSKNREVGAAPGDHSGFVQPVYSWVPSIGISNLIRVSGGLFPMWRGDLMVGGLSGLGNGRGLFRVRLLEGRAISVERIPTESRVRDLIQLPEGGPLVLWDGQRNIRVVRPADHVFSSCASCHGVRNAQHGIGPDLFGVVGRPVATFEDFPYSSAMQQYGGSWTPARLSRFLEQPQREVPGTSMEHVGIPDAMARAELIQFLSDITGGRPVD